VCISTGLYFGLKLLVRALALPELAESSVFRIKLVSKVRHYLEHIPLRFTYPGANGSHFFRYTAELPQERCLAYATLAVHIVDEAPCRVLWRDTQVMPKVSYCILSAHERHPHASLENILEAGTRFAIHL
jgi:hypothetical protein